MMLVQGAHGSRLIHIANPTGETICGAHSSYPLVRVHNEDLLCWGCIDLVVDSDPLEYPFVGIEEQVGRLLETMPYTQYLKSRHWLWLRDVALDYYGRSCTLCGTHRGIQVHHRTYDRRGHETLADLTVLCDPCHSRYHGKAA